MSQIQIAEIIEQIKQEIEVDANGQGKASIRAAARLAGVDEKAIRSSLDGAELKPSKLAIILIEHGFHPAELAQWRTNGIPDIAIAIIIERIHDPRFGRVGLYPESVLIEVFKTEQK
jgi:hypothetical protein